MEGKGFPRARKSEEFPYVLCILRMGRFCDVGKDGASGSRKKRDKKYFYNSKILNKNIRLIIGKFVGIIL